MVLTQPSGDGTMILNLLILSVAIFVVANFLPGIYIKGPGTAVIVAVVYSIINFFLGWLFMLLSLPLVIITFGLFVFVVNAFLLWITDRMIDDFEINSFGTTLVAAFLITVIDSGLHWLF